MKKLSRTLITSLLIAVFGVFTVGLPIVRYLCPMMNEDVMTCPYSPQSKHLGATIAGESPSCCVSYIIAERNTTPYTSVEKSAPQDLQSQTLAVLVDLVTVHSASSLIVPFCTTSSPPPRGEPLYVLNSSFLI
jgi:hypothetical protein